jgi:hypothetical protein
MGTSAFGGVLSTTRGLQIKTWACVGTSEIFLDIDKHISIQEDNFTTPSSLFTLFLKW